MKKLIISFDLSKEEVTDIPHPDDARYQYDHEISKYDVIHYLRTPDDFILPESVFRHDESCFSISNLGGHMINAPIGPIFVQSLVSPYFNVCQKRADRNMKKLMIISFDLSKEEVTEIPQPDDARYEYKFSS
ncbi:hypothetical protein E3N88_16533 [Mikania micrantha]|uniref:Uncharacterized protein n=1 Tax=Mikania micrantha TaxID=192012 RepID=A0A5N6P0R4_9ASTR|nr:hypothetical protein E3N88_16533 [Mikania micrantha]